MGSYRILSASTEEGDFEINLQLRNLRTAISYYNSAQTNTEQSKHDHYNAILAVQNLGAAVSQILGHTWTKSGRVPSPRDLLKHLMESTSNKHPEEIVNRFESLIAPYDATRHFSKSKHDILLCLRRRLGIAFE